ncbi:MAG: metalloregulator ArsR/SmtB family transcription factor [Desulfobacterales bacterium]|nr:metalloregulator ArsR/SmtB family transcription factor [Desulfobacterales bacterium]
MSRSISRPAKSGDRSDLPAESVAHLCKALGHPARMVIIDYLKANNDCVCGRIVEQLPLAQSTVSQHLKILKDSGLIQDTSEGSARRYCLNRPLMTRLKHSLAELLQT